MKKVSDICLAKIKEFEGFRGTAYYCPGGKLTIGYGHTGMDVHPGDVISKYWAEHLLKADLYDLEKQVESLGEWNQPQFDALVSFAYNLGFYKLKTSTLLKTIVRCTPSRRSSSAGCMQEGRSSKVSNVVANGKPNASLRQTRWNR